MFNVAICVRVRLCMYPSLIPRLITPGFYVVISLGTIEATLASFPGLSPQAFMSLARFFVLQVTLKPGVISLGTRLHASWLCGCPPLPNKSLPLAVYLILICVIHPTGKDYPIQASTRDEMLVWIRCIDETRVSDNPCMGFHNGQVTCH